MKELSAIFVPTKNAVQQAWKGPVIAALLFLLMTAWLGTAWLCDDAFITFRTVDNFIHGYGMRWNSTERVQSFTHPLWFLLISGLYRITGELFFSPLALSIGISGLSAYLLATLVGRSTIGAAIGLLLLLGSRAAIQYSTSGLENPLSHLLLVVLFWAALCAPSARCLPATAASAALLLLNRLDLLFLIAPLFLITCWQSRSRRTLTTLVLCALPLLAWYLFAWIYFGTPFPNTAYAKLQTGVPRADLVQQGLLYLRNSISTDLVTLPTIALGMGLGALMQRRAQALSLGIVLMLMYVVWIGGDFMSGRFLTPVFMIALCLVVQFVEQRCQGGASQRKFLVTAASAVMAAILLHLAGIGDPETHYDKRLAVRCIDRWGIADEWGCFQPWSSPWRMYKHSIRPDNLWAQAGVQAKALAETPLVWPYIGYFGFFAGANVHIVDPFGLADALLARLPRSNAFPFRPGHVRRAIPAGYLETLKSGKNQIEDPEIAKLYETVYLLTRAPLFDADRLRALVWLPKR